MAEPKEPLTERELEVVRLLGTGVGNKEMAAQLHLSTNTVKVHLRNIFTKLEAESRTEVTMISIRNGWISVDQPIAAKAIANGQITSTESIEQTSSTESLPTHSEIRETASVNVPIPAIIVPVAPNPQPIPPMASWRRATLIASVLVLFLFVGAAIPLNAIGSSDTFDPLRIGPSQPRSGLLSKGETSRWYLRTALPAPRARSVAITANNHIYLIGGEVNQVVSPDVLVFVPVSNTWAILNSPKPTAVANTAAVSFDSHIYVSGGTTAEGNASRAFEVFDTQSERWDNLAPLPTALAGHAMAIAGNQIYVFGGAGQSGATNTGFRYDIVSASWHSISPMRSSRSLLAASAVNDWIYVIGGYIDGRELTTCEYYSPSSDTWTTCASMTIPRSGLGLAHIGSSLFAIGGGATGFMGFNERYDTLADRWTPLETPLTSDWQSVAVASMPSEFFAFGGYSNGERLSFTYVYEVFTNRAYVPAFLVSDGTDKKP